MPIFKNFVKQALYKEDFKPFLIPKEIIFSAVNYNTGEIESFTSPDAILEAFKLSDLQRMQNKNLNKNTNYDKLIKYRQFY